MKINLMKRIVSGITCAMLTMGMIGTTPVSAINGDATIDTTKSVTLTIHKLAPKPVENAMEGNGVKLSNLPKGTSGLPGIQFKISKTNIKIAPGDVSTLSVTAAQVKADSATYNVTEKKIVTTGEDGTVVVTGLEQAVYLVEEIPNPSVKSPIPDFLVSLPMTNADGNGWNYDVHVYPKNDVIDGPKIDKDVKSTNNDHTSAKVGDKVEWIIRPEIPSDLYFTDAKNEEVYAKNFEIVDNIDAALKYIDTEDPSFKINGVDVALVKGIDYTATLVGATDGKGGTFTIKLLNPGMKKIMEAANYKNPITELKKLDIYFKTEITKDALSKDAIFNGATLNYTNHSNKNYNPSVADGDKPEVHTGSTGLTKYAKDTNDVLKDAEFKIASSQENAKAGRFLQYDSVTGKVSEWTEGAANDYTVKSGVDGVVKFQGLAFDEANINGSKDYWIVETQAPNEYSLLKDPVKVTVEKNSSLDNSIATVKIYNAHKFRLPLTGGKGNTIFIVAGTSLIIFAGILLVLSRKKKNA
ncbi:SpaH/EbpB family LPXTG-anchored major pilin [Clostridium cadaveris]|uniref:SpaH/EbpB family LPXTG-anchored major pilin n=1 Tax=Clostridium cadaveris TaxID=1529 RepID=UPI00040B88B4|nr:SpaH/EbpB family LPXTG-anchored major pilin [Clostridium cadaveris]